MPYNFTSQFWLKVYILCSNHAESLPFFPFVILLILKEDALFQQTAGFVAILTDNYT